MANNEERCGKSTAKVHDEVGSKLVPVSKCEGKILKWKRKNLLISF